MVMQSKNNEKQNDVLQMGMYHSAFTRHTVQYFVMYFIGIWTGIHFVSKPDEFPWLLFIAFIVFAFLNASAEKRRIFIMEKIIEIQAKKLVVAETLMNLQSVDEKEKKD